MRTGEIHAVLVRHQLLPYGVTGAGTQVLGLTDTAEVARALLALEARLREVERERDAARQRADEIARSRALVEERAAAVERQRDTAERGLADAHDMLKRAVRIEKAAGEVVEAHAASRAALTKLMSEGTASWMREYNRLEDALATLRAAMEGKSDA